jgi:DNA adenine methylase
VVAVPVRPRRLAGLTGVPHAIPYQGSKRRLAHAIANLIPADVAVLHEPFAGSAAVTIAARHLGLAHATRISDINEPLMDLWADILARPSSLADQYEHLWHAQLSDPRSYYEHARNRFNATREPRFLLYLLARCVKAAVRYNRNGEFNQAADHRRLGVRPPQMRARLTGASATLAGTIVRTVDYVEVLRSAADRDVVYLDPPYEGVSDAHDQRYVRGVRRDAFERELAAAIRRGTSFIVSYDGASGGKAYGCPLSAELRMLHLLLHAGRSSQATLLGQRRDTVESLYLSPMLVDRLGGAARVTAILTTELGDSCHP